MQVAAGRENVHSLVLLVETRQPLSFEHPSDFCIVLFMEEAMALGYPSSSDQGK